MGVVYIYKPGPPGVDGSNGALANGNKGPRPGFPTVIIIPSHALYGRGVLPLAFHPPGPPSEPICPFERIQVQASIARKKGK